MTFKKALPGKVFFLFAFFFFLALSLGSQELQTGSIRGKVIDEEGMPLPGVTVTVRGSALLGKITDVTRQDGSFRIPSLPPGSDYEVRAELQGFETVVRKGIIVNSGIVVTIEITMKPSAIQEEVTVIGASPVVDVVKSTKRNIVTKEVLQSLPLSRGYASLIRTAPGTVEYTIYGSGRGEAGVSVDGVISNDPDQNAPAIGTDAGMAWDMVEEVEIVTSGATAEHYSSPFGQINIIMKSGGNKLTGELSFYYTNEDLSKINLREEDLNVLNLARPSFPVYSYDASAALGGAIIKDKIWYMGEFRHQRSLRKGDFRPTVILGKKYENYDRLFPNYIGYLKLTFQLAKNVRGTAMAHYSEQDVPYYYGGWYLTNEANRHNNPKRLNYAGTLTWIINNNNLLNLRIGGLYFKWTGVPTKDANPDGPMYVDRYTGYQWGSTDYQWTYKPSLNIVVSLTKYVDDFLGGNHEFKAGAEWQRNRGDWGFYLKNNMTWYYYNENPYYWRALNNGVTDPVYGDGQLTFQAIGKAYGESYQCGITSRFGGFVQDMFTIKRFTISAGVRLDTLKAWVPGRKKGAAGNPLSIAIGETYFKPIYGINPYDEISYPTWDNAFPYGVFISPRLGITFDVFGDHKTALKFSFSHQAEPFPTGVFSGMYPLTYRSFTFNWWDLNNNGIPDPPPVDQYKEAYGANPLVMVGDTYLKAIDPDARPPYVDEFNLSLEHELLEDFKLGVSYVYKKRGDILDSVLWDTQTGRYWYTYEKAPEWWVPFTTIVPAYGMFPEAKVTMYFLSKNAPPLFYRLTNIPEARWKSRSVEIFFNKRMSKGWMLGGSINFLKSTGNYPIGWSEMYSRGTLANPNGFVNGDGELNWSRPIIIKLYGTFVLPYQIVFSFFYQHIDGTPWNRTVTVVPPAKWAQEHNAQTVTFSINVEPRGCRRNEPSDNIDVRFEKNFTIGPGKLGFFIDIFNLMGSYTLTVSKNPAGTWRPADENTRVGTFTPTSLGLKGFSGYREVRFSFRYSF